MPIAPKPSSSRLDSIIAAETKHRDELRLMLSRWP
jgi:hypothetical protein